LVRKRNCPKPFCMLTFAGLQKSWLGVSGRVGTGAAGDRSNFLPGVGAAAKWCGSASLTWLDFAWFYSTLDNTGIFRHFTLLHFSIFFFGAFFLFCDSLLQVPESHPNSFSTSYQKYFKFHFTETFTRRSVPASFLNLWNVSWTQNCCWSSSVDNPCSPSLLGRICYLYKVPSTHFRNVVAWIRISLSHSGKSWISTNRRVNIFRILQQYSNNKRLLSMITVFMPKLLQIYFVIHFFPSSSPKKPCYGEL
jgi:hypothetical protein